tara:strand:+ start:1626 stop:2531 length:906 start_codon:yes stop_codon:yes gene_type:complete
MKKIIIGDGAMGTELRARGIEVPSHTESIWSALALKNNPQDIIKVHEDYIEAGSDYITINNYAVTKPLLSRKNLEQNFKDLTETAVNLAREAVSAKKSHTKIAASFPPLETSYRPDLVPSKKDLINYYAEFAEILSGNVDFIICETMTTKEEGRIALEMAKKTKLPVWLGWTLMGNRFNKLPSGENLIDATKYCLDLDPDAILLNCCGINLITEGLKELNQIQQSIPIGGFANNEKIIKFSNTNSVIKNAEEIHYQNSQKVDEIEYSEEVLKWIDLGATIVAGCCRTRPSHIKTIKDRIYN